MALTNPSLETASESLSLSLFLVVLVCLSLSLSISASSALHEKIDSKTYEVVHGEVFVQGSSTGFEEHS